MNYLSVENLSKSYGDKHLFSNITFGISQGEKAAIVAGNGTGKTSLLNILRGKEISDEGTVAFRQDLRVAFLEQEPQFEEGQTVYTALFNSGSPLLKCIKDYETAQVNYENNPDNNNERLLQEAMMQMDQLNAWDYEKNIRLILSRLNIHDLQQVVDQLSGGQKKRLALARILIDSPQMLIMDEPTNHLDVDMIEWLESYFERHDITLLLVTHDRYFLDNVCTDILEIDDGKLYRYKGNYEYFLTKKAEREFNMSREMDKAMNLYKRELEWVRKMPKARGTKSKSRIDAFEELQQKVKGKKKEAELQLNIKMNRLGGKVLELKNITKRYGNKTLLKNFDYTFKKGERIGIVGKNGVGKSTLLNILTGNDTPDAGQVNPGDTLVFGYYSQTGIQLKEDRRVIEVVKDIAEVIPLADGTKVTASQFLQLFKFSPELQFNYVSKLSGGERKRLFLLTVLIKNPNFLILDEPTNDLDLVTLTVLEDFLINYPGCLIMVSHDRYFMDKLVDHLLVFEGDGVVKDFNGSYAEYRLMKAEEEKNTEKNYEKSNLNEATKNNQVANKPPAKQKLSYKEKLEFERLDKEIPELEAQRVALTNKLNSGLTDHVELLKISEDLQVLNESLDEKTLRWLELSEKV